MDKIIEKWDEILNTVKQEYEISDVSFDTWIRPLEVFAIEGNTLYILVPSEQMALIPRSTLHHFALRSWKLQKLNMKSNSSFRKRPGL